MHCWSGSFRELLLCSAPGSRRYRPYTVGIFGFIQKSGKRFHKEIGINRRIFVVRYGFFLKKYAGVVCQNKGKEFFRYFGADIIRVGGGDGKRVFLRPTLSCRSISSPTSRIRSSESISAVSRLTVAGVIPVSRAMSIREIVCFVYIL